MTVKWLRKFDPILFDMVLGDCYSSLTVELLLDRTKKEKHMDDLQYLNYQLQLLEREREEFLADGSVLPEVQPQSEDCNQTSMGETK